MTPLMRPVIILIVLLATLGTARLARAADTVEPWGVGATDVDFYLGYSGLGLKRPDRSVWANIMFGYGVTSRLSAYLSQSLETPDNNFAAAGGSTNLGLYAGIVATKHFDLDLFFDVGLGGEAYRELSITPMVELNFDLDDDLKSWGAYIRHGLLIHGHLLGADPAAGIPGRPEMLYSLFTTLGTYYTIKNGHQLLLQFDFTYHTIKGPYAHQLELGGLALGYNVGLTGAMELINEIHLDIPQAGERFNVSIFTGFIVTLPGVKKTNPSPKPPRRIAPRAAPALHVLR